MFSMELTYKGKTKDVYKLEDGNNLLVFKDNVTSSNGVFDPGANVSELTIKDNGYYGLLMSEYFFKLFEQEGIKTQYVSSDMENRTMTVKPVTFFGKGIEVICRLAATGSFMRRYGGYATEGQKLDYYTEISLKDDERGDPFISEELLILFDILKPGEYDIIKEMNIKITKIIERELAQKGIELIDLKLEFGRDKNGEILLIDEVSGGNMRAYKDGKSLEPIELSKIITGE